MTLLPIPLTDELKNIFDAFSVSSTIAAIVSGIPVIVGALTAVWIIYRIYDLRLSIKLKKQQLKDS
jgi:hypothetical protein